MSGPRPFRFGVIHEQPQPPTTWASHLRRIEDLGFSTFLIRDHFLAMPSVFIGSVGEIVDQMEERRARYGFSYYVVSDRHLDRAAPLVARLAAG